MNPRLRRLLRETGLVASRPLRRSSWWQRRDRGRLGRIRSFLLYDPPPEGTTDMQVGSATVRVSARFARHNATGFEPLSMRWLTESISSGDHLVDVGAHVGIVTVAMATGAGPSGRIVAVEPGPANVALLRENISAQGLNNVVILAGAVDETTGSREILLTDADDSHGFYRHPFAKVTSSQEVQVWSLESIIDEQLSGRCDLVKIDVEGAELDVLRGLGRFGSGAGRPTLLVEWNPSCQRLAGVALSAVPDLLASRGYSVTVLDESVGRPTEVDKVLAREAAGDLPASWYGNLIAVPR